MKVNLDPMVIIVYPCLSSFCGRQQDMNATNSSSQLCQAWQPRSSPQFTTSMVYLSVQIVAVHKSAKSGVVSHGSLTIRHFEPGLVRSTPA